MHSFNLLVIQRALAKLNGSQRKTVGHESEKGSASNEGAARNGKEMMRGAEKIHCVYRIAKLQEKGKIDPNQHEAVRMQDSSSLCQMIQW